MSATPLSLIAGFRRFREQHFEHNDSLYQQLVKEGQTPKTLVVACCDSRVDPALVFECDPGDLLVIRNVANLVPPLEEHSGHHGTTAAIEYGVSTLGVKHIIVLGHAHCGGSMRWSRRAESARRALTLTTGCAWWKARAPK